jgi:hypothetical protein
MKKEGTEEEERIGFGESVEKNVIKSYKQQTHTYLP